MNNSLLSNHALLSTCNSRGRGGLNFNLCTCSHYSPQSHRCGKYSANITRRCWFSSVWKEAEEQTIQAVTGTSIVNQVWSLCEIHFLWGPLDCTVLYGWMQECASYAGRWRHTYDKYTQWSLQFSTDAKHGCHILVRFLTGLISAQQRRSVSLCHLTNSSVSVTFHACADRIKVWMFLMLNAIRPSRCCWNGPDHILYTSNSAALHLPAGAANVSRPVCLH